MKTESKLLIAFTLIGFLSSCKKNEDVVIPTSDTNVENLRLLTKITVNANRRMAQLGKEKGLSYGDALATLTAELQLNKDVDEAWLVDSTYLYIQKNSLTQVISVNETDQNGISIYRGSGKHLATFGKTMLSNDEVIDNNKVLCFVPKLAEFYFNEEDYIEQVVKKLDKAKVDLKVDVLFNEKASLDALRSMGAYGLVLIETHGTPDALMTGEFTFMDTTDFGILDQETRFNDWLKEAFGQNVINLLADGQARLVQRVDVDKTSLGQWWNKIGNAGAQLFELEITTRGIRQLNADLSGTVVFGNMCYSGFNEVQYQGKTVDPIRSGFLAKNPISYYAYSLADGSGSCAVTNSFAKECLDTLLHSLVYDIDSTVLAHLFNNQTKAFDPNLLVGPKKFRKQLYFNHYGKEHYTYPLQTFTDPRDQEVYRILEVGNQVWFAENLRYKTSASQAPNGDINLVELYGRLYHSHDLMQSNDPVTVNTQKGVKGICPEGRHIPSHLEWLTFEEQTGYKKDGTSIDKNGRVENLGGQEMVAYLIADSTEWVGGIDQTYSSLINKSKFSIRPAGIAKSDITYEGNIETDVSYILKGKAAYLATSSYFNYPLTETITIQYLMNRVYSNNYSRGDRVHYKLTNLKAEMTYMSCRCLKD